MTSANMPGPVELLRQLVASPSVSSTRPSLDQGNRQVIDLLAGWLQDIGFNVEVMPLNESGSKANLIASLGSGPGGLVLAGHTDTVPFDDGLWSSDPLSLTERDQRLYGLGSTDMKGFFPLIIQAVRNMQKTDLRQPLIILATADEECTMNGARTLADAGRPLGRQAIIGEPTSLAPVRLHKGIMMENIEIRGSSGHSSDPALGDNALEGLHAVLGLLMSYRDELAERGHHPLLDVAHPTLNLGCVHGGDSPNRICGRAEVHFDVRVTPGLRNADIREEIRERLNALAGELAGKSAGKQSLQFEMTSLIHGAEPYEQPEDSELVRLAEKLTGHRAEAVAFATEAPYLQQMGMDTIVMGPGSIKRAHQPDEYIELDQFNPCIDLLQQFIGHYCLTGASP